MAYEGLDKFLVKATLREITRLENDDSGAGYMRIAENVYSFCESKTISPNQAEVIFEAMEWEDEIPDYEPEQTSEGLTLQDVSDAVAELSEVVSEMLEGEEE